MMLLRAANLQHRFGGVTAVDEVNLDVAAGEIVGLIGPNGAGKSTVVNILTGYIKPSSGNVEFLSKDITTEPPSRRAKLGLSRTFQNVRLFKHLSVFENVAAGAYLLGESGVFASMLRLPSVRRDNLLMTAAAGEALERVELGHLAQTPAHNLSTGDMRLVEVARAVASKPRLVFLDEPAAGLNDTETARLSAVIRSLRRGGTAILIIEHHLKMMLELCDRIFVLDRGRLLATGTPSEIKRHPGVRAAYVGGA
jgi:ABC-type branched-subunit amino acid transport system ATPase component